MSFLGTQPPWLLTKAAYGGLKSFPVQRFRGARPHLLYSMAALMRLFATRVRLRGAPLSDNFVPSISRKPSSLIPAITNKALFS